jgi:hypothetical protein
LADGVSEEFGIGPGLYDDGQVPADRWLGGDRTPGLQVPKLGSHPWVRGSQQPDVR